MTAEGGDDRIVPHDVLQAGDLDGGCAGLDGGAHRGGEHFGADFLEVDIVFALEVAQQRMIGNDRRRFGGGLAHCAWLSMTKSSGNFIMTRCTPRRSVMRLSSWGR